MERTFYGGIELGGTNVICAVADTHYDIVARVNIPTTSVDETFEAIFEFFEHQARIVSLGVGSFGPVQLNLSSEKFGHIYNSPKAGWTEVNVKGLLEQRLKVAVTIDTDVNCAAIGELHFGVAKNVRDFIYLSLGTGIGGGFISNGKLIHGIRNLEMGHMRVPHETFTDSFDGACVFHGDCLEGIASGHAMAVRYSKSPVEITDSEVWDVEARYISLALNNLMMTIGPALIVVGGGLTNHPGLLTAVRSKVKQSINHYLDFPNLESYIVKSSGEMNGVLGAIKLASHSK